MTWGNFFNILFPRRKYSWDFKITFLFLISSFRRVQNVVCFLLGDSLASDLYMPTFRNTLSVPSSKADLSLKMEQIVFRNVGIYKSDAGESPKRKQTTYFLNFPSLPNIRNERGLFILFDRQTPAQIPASIVS